MPPQFRAIAEMLGQAIMAEFMQRFPGGFIDPRQQVLVASRDENGIPFNKATNLHQQLEDLTVVLRDLAEIEADALDAVNTKRRRR
jgi:hypothetical protein